MAKTTKKRAPRKGSSSRKSTTAKKSRPKNSRTAKGGSGQRGGKKTKSTKKGSTKATATVDRRRESERRNEKEPRRQKCEEVVPEKRKLERRAAVSRRRQIDPTTCERDYTNEEIEFMSALDDYKRNSGRMFPTCSEVLEVIKGLGYAKPGVSDADAEPSVVNVPVSPELGDGDPVDVDSDLSSDSLGDEGPEEVTSAEDPFTQVVF